MSETGNQALPHPIRLALPADGFVAETASVNCARFQECRDLLRPRLSKPLLRAFLELTGLRLHVLWHNPLELQLPDTAPVLCPAAALRCETHTKTFPMCQDCLRRNWNPTVRNAGRKRVFEGDCGATNFRASLTVGDTRPLTLVLQTFPASASTCAPATRTRASASMRAASSASGRRALPGVPFNAALALLRVILHDLEATVQASLVQRELETVRLRLNRLEAEGARLRRELRSRAPGIPQAPVLCGGGTRSQQISQRMLEYIHAHYHRPLQLSDLATALKMNACYLSSLFSRTLGMTFHRYLDELRLARAKELLRDPTYRVCEAAFAVGYASTRHFWRAFKAHTGVGPSVWRDGEQRSPPSAH